MGHGPRDRCNCPKSGPDNPFVRRGCSGKDSGQAAVESALVMPLMVFLTLGIIQLTAIEHAKLMTEYAAYQAARAGIVWSGNNERMHDAAIMAVLPTIGRTDDLGHMAATWALAHLYDNALRALSWGGVQSINGSNLLGLVRVDTINPAYFTPIDSIWKLPWGVNWQELDFDGPDSYPEVPALARQIAKFFDLNIPDNQEEVYRKSTVLSIRLRYWYEMRIPFANWVIFLSWYASNATVALHGALDRPTTTANQTVTNRTTNVNSLEGQARGIWNQKGYATVYPPEMWVLWGLANGSIPLLSGAIGTKYFIPLSATYSMRMQSNFDRKWLMHLNPSWGL